MSQPQALLRPVLPSLSLPSFVQSATTAATTIRATAWQVEQERNRYVIGSRPVRRDQLWQGFVERWQQKYSQNGKYGICDVTCVDALAPLSQLTLGYVMPDQVAATNPNHMFPLSSAAASFQERLWRDLERQGKQC